MTPSITLHALAQSRSLRIVWLLEELGLPYTLTQHPRDARTLLAPPALKAVHPLGKAPVLQDGELVLAESGAIADYLVTTYGQGDWRPPEHGSAAYWQHQRWLHYAEGSLMPLNLLALVLRRIELAPMPFFVRPVARGITAKVRQGFVAPQAALHLHHLDDALSRTPWLMGGAPSAADVMLSFPVQAATSRLGADRDHPHLAAWLARIEARAAYQRAVAKAGQPL